MLCYELRQPLAQCRIRCRNSSRAGSVNHMPPRTWQGGPGRTSMCISKRAGVSRRLSIIVISSCCAPSCSSCQAQASPAEPRLRFLSCQSDSCSSVWCDAGSWPHAASTYSCRTPHHCRAHAAAAASWLSSRDEVSLAKSPPQLAHSGHRPQSQRSATQYRTQARPEPPSWPNRGHTAGDSSLLMHTSPATV